MELLVETTRQRFQDEDIHPLLTVADFVVRFLAIHPFQDGNGRLSRILTNLLLLRNGYAFVQYEASNSPGTLFRKTGMIERQQEISGSY